MVELIDVANDLIGVSLALTAQILPYSITSALSHIKLSYMSFSNITTTTSK